MTRWVPRLATALLAVLLSVIVMFWWLRIAAGPPAAPANTLAKDTTLVSSPTEITALFPQVIVTADSDFKLLGVIAQSNGGGRALIAVGDKPAKPFAPGTQLAPGVVIKRVDTRSVVLDRNGSQSQLTLPKGKIAAVSPLPGALPSAGAAAAAVLFSGQAPRVGPAIQNDIGIDSNGSNNSLSNPQNNPSNNQSPQPRNGEGRLNMLPRGGANN